VYNRGTGVLERILRNADEDIVNCVQPHPFEPVGPPYCNDSPFPIIIIHQFPYKQTFASSGIEAVVKMWRPEGEAEYEDYEEMMKPVASNGRSARMIRQLDLLRILLGREAA